MRVAAKVCLKCGGDAYISDEQLPDGIYEMYCLQCGSRDFPDEVALVANTLRKLRKKVHK
jgi:predicted nucleic-acid-binding Zn-ribbon protein|tara:strand:- start:495 stop:674 length:180 start_codon:yes stop_codon:yes gene_type:complete